jgi:hypothetical protein
MIIGENSGPDDMDVNRTFLASVRDRRSDGGVPARTVLSAMDAGFAK